MLKYNSALKNFSRELRAKQTDAERLLWSKIRNKQIAGLRFSRQKPIGNYIVDFYCFELKLVVELDGDQHFWEKGKSKDGKRDRFLKERGFEVLRISNNEIYKNIEGVVQGLWNIAEKPTQKQTQTQQKPS